MTNRTLKKEYVEIHPISKESYEVMWDCMRFGSEMIYADHEDQYFFHLGFGSRKEDIGFNIEGDILKQIKSGFLRHVHEDGYPDNTFILTEKEMREAYQEEFLKFINYFDQKFFRKYDADNIDNLKFPRSILEKIIDEEEIDSPYKLIQLIKMSVIQTQKDLEMQIAFPALTLGESRCRNWIVSIDEYYKPILDEVKEILLERSDPKYKYFKESIKN